MESKNETLSVQCPRCGSTECRPDPACNGNYFCKNCLKKFEPGQQLLETTFRDAEHIGWINKFKQLLAETARPGMEELLAWLDTTDFYDAPASTKFHGAHRGGLLAHCMHVLALFNKRCEEFDMKIPRDSIIICSLLHDLCKIFLYKGVPGSYTYDSEMVKRHASLSLQRIARFIQLTELEAGIIRFHMGLHDCMEVKWKGGEFGKEVYYSATNKEPVVLLFHHCDDQACKFLEK